MIPAQYNIKAYQADAFVLDIPLQKTNAAGARVPLTVGEATSIRDTYTVIRMQVRQDRDSPILVSASKADSELYIDPDFTLPDGTHQPVFSLRIPGEKLVNLVDAKYDIEFDFPDSLGPYTALAGSFELVEEITHDQTIP